MLLRSSSSPILSSLASHVDLFLEGVDHESSPLRHLPPTPQRSPFINSNRGISVHSAFSDPDAVKSLPRMRRALSDGDLEGMGRWPADESTEIRCRLRSKGALSKLSIEEEEEEEEEEESDFTTAEYCFDVRASSPILEDSEIKALNTRVSAMVPQVSRGFRMEDGEYYSSRMMSSTGQLLICNSKGCRPLTESEKLSPMYMARGLGVRMGTEESNINGGEGGLGGHGSGGGSGSSGSYHDDSNMTEAHYQKLLKADPQNPLLLRNYAQFLSEAKHDQKKSEEYYERAILACPNDGEVLSKYAKHVWDVHKDYDRAESYFDQAVKATPDDCYVLASYASFLWGSEDDEESDAIPHTVLPSLHGVGTGPVPLVTSA